MKNVSAKVRDRVWDTAYGQINVANSKLRAAVHSNMKDIVVTNVTNIKIDIERFIKEKVVT